METARRLHEKHELLKKKQEYLNSLAEFLSGTFGDSIKLTIDESEYVTAEIETQDGVLLYRIQYSVWGDNNNGMFRDTLRSLIREGYMEELY